MVIMRLQRVELINAIRTLERQRSFQGGAQERHYALAKQLSELRRFKVRCRSRTSILALSWPRSAFDSRHRILTCPGSPSSSPLLVSRQVKFDKRYNLAPDGKPLPPSWYQRLMGVKPMAALEKRLAREIKAASRIEKELAKMKGARAQQLKLLEYSRLDYLNPLERRIYVKNAMKVGTLLDPAFTPLVPQRGPADSSCFVCRPLPSPYVADLFHSHSRRIRQEPAHPPPYAVCPDAGRGSRGDDPRQQMRQVLGHRLRLLVGRWPGFLRVPVRVRPRHS